MSKSNASRHRSDRISQVYQTYKSRNATVRRRYRLAAEVAARSIRNSIIGQKTRTDTLTVRTGVA